MPDDPLQRDVVVRQDAGLIRRSVDAGQVDPALDQVRGKAVAERMAMNRPAQASRTARRGYFPLKREGVDVVSPELASLWTARQLP